MAESLLPEVGAMFAAVAGDPLLLPGSSRSPYPLSALALLSVFVESTPRGLGLLR